MPPKRLADCYFFYYSSCVRGDQCRFRHCAEALGTETICPGWRDKTCREINCKYRHMEIEKNRTQESCFWETQLGGCTKPHCAFYHQSLTKNLHAASGLAMSLPPKPKFENKEYGAQRKSLQDALDDSLADYFKKPSLGEEKEYNNPSPKVPPVVFNPYDEESDQEMTSPEKLVEKEIGALERKINVLEEESRVIQQENTPHIRVKSDILSRLGRKRNQDEQLRVVQITSLNTDSVDQPEAQVVRCNIAGVKNRLGKRKTDESNKSQLIGNLSDATKLSSSVDEEHTQSGFEKVKIKSLAEIREEKEQRLGLDIDSHEPPSKVRRQSDTEETAPSSRVNPNTKGTNGDLNHIKIKSLSDIRKEKGLTDNLTSESSSEKQKPIVSAPSMKNQDTSLKKATIKSSNGEVRIKSFEEIMRDKRSRHQESNTEITSTEHIPSKVLKQEATTTSLRTEELSTSQATVKVKGMEFRKNGKSEPDSNQLENPEIKKEEETVQSHDAPDSTQDVLVKQEVAVTRLDEVILTENREAPAPGCGDSIVKPETPVISCEPATIKAASQIEFKRQISTESSKLQASRLSLGSNVDELELLLMEDGEETNATQHIDDEDILKELDNMLQ